MPLSEEGRARIRNARTTHGSASRGSQSPEYKTWAGVLRRCLFDASPKNKYYGMVSVAQEWQGIGGFANFLQDMGPKPSPAHTIERIKNDDGYAPGNCRWATRKEQSVNRRNVKMLEFNGKKQTVADWARELDVDDATIHYRLKHDWPIEKVLAPARRRV